MLVAQSIVEAGEILDARRTRHVAHARGGLGEEAKMREPPVARCQQGAMDLVYGVARGRAAGRPHREHERQAGPALPLLAQVVAVRVGVPRGQEQCGIPDHQHGIVRQPGEPV